MKLKSFFRLCVTVVGASMLTMGTRAADVIVTRTSELTGEVVRVEGDDIVIRLGVGEVRVSKKDVVRVNIPTPAGLAGGRAALTAGKFSEAVTALKPIVDRYGGLPMPWIQDAMLALGDAYLGMKDDSRAQAVFQRFGGLYPDAAGSGTLAVKMARVAAGQGRHAEALTAANKFLEPLLKKEPLTDQETAGLADALVLQGDCLRATKELPKALDSYLLVTTLFDENDALTAEVILKAGQVFEQMENPKRARETYQELVRDYPASPQAKSAGDRLAALEKTGAQ